jgi:hypothetical protein
VALAQFKGILKIQPNLTLKPDKEETIKYYERVHQIDLPLNIDLESWHFLFWHGALNRFAQDVTGAC